MTSGRRAPKPITRKAKPKLAPALASLRDELATVSPSLMDWMKQLPALTMPLAESIAALEQAARELEDGERSARRLLEAPSA